MEPISSAPKQNAEPTLHTAGGAYISGNVVAETFIGRDQYNYYFIGLAPLVHDPTRRFRNFLNEYLGTPGQSVPFGGRQAQLEELYGWLNDANAPPYYLMTAEAGRGKSALVCRWMEEVRRQQPEVEVIFIPISIRFETAAQDTVFAALAARLAQFYDEPLKPAALSGAQWQGVCESYLDRTPPAGKKLLIILDGLDEATGWRFGAGFFSTDPPPGLRVVVTARLRVGESTPQGWAATLGWHERLTKMVTLPPLSRIGIEEALTSMGDPLAGFADQVTIVEQLYRLTEGDPLLVRLYVQEFEKQKATVGTLNSATLQQMTPGLQGYFDQWWRGQNAQWRAQGSDPEKEEAHLRLLLDALAAALGPLTLDDLAQLHPELRSSRLIRAQLQSVERWVIGDGKTQGYSYSHARLGYYFWEQLSNHEQRKWDERFITWGKQILQELKLGTLIPHLAPRYLLQHYVVHLERVIAPSTDFYALVCESWLRAWESVNGTPDGFLNDINHAWAAAEAEGAAALGQAVRVALCFSSVSSISTNIDTKLLVVCVKAGVISPHLALVITQMKPEEKERLDCLTKLCAYLPSELLLTVLAMRQAIDDEEKRLKILQAVIARLPVDNNTLLAEILTAARTVRNEGERAKVLSIVAEHLPLGQQQTILVEALTAAQIVCSPSLKMQTLLSVTERLPLEQQLSVLTEALIVANTIDDGWEWLKTFITTINHLPSIASEQLTDALLIARSIDDKRKRAIALGSVAVHLPTDQQFAIQTEALTVAHAINDKFERIQTLSALAEDLPPNQQSSILFEVLVEARTTKDELALTERKPIIPYDWPWTGTLRILTERLLADDPILLTEALAIVRTIEGKVQRVEAFSAIAKRLPLEQKITVLTEALAAVLATEDKKTNNWFMSLVPIGWPWTGVLRTVAEPLLKDVPALLTEVLAVVGTMSNKQERVNALIAMADHLSSHQQAVVLDEALNLARTISEAEERSGALVAIAEHLPHEQQRVILVEALAAARAIDDKARRVWMLCMVAEFDSAVALVLLTEALNLAYTINNKSEQVQALCTVARHLPLNQRLAVLAKALDAACSKWDLRTVLTCSTLHTPELLSKALVVVRNTSDEGDRLSALRIVVEYLPKDTANLLIEAIEIARTIRYEGWQAEALSLVATRLSANMRDLLVEILTAVRTFDNEGMRFETLGLVAESLPLDASPLLIEVLAAARRIGDKEERVRALGAVAELLSSDQQSILLMETLALVRTIHDEKKRSEALALVAIHLPSAAPPLLSEALATVHTINNEMWRAYPLGSLGSCLPSNHPELLTEALTLAHTFQDEGWRAYALGVIVLHLPVEQREAVLAEILSIARTIDNEWQRRNVVRNVASHLPTDVPTLLAKALDVARTFDHERLRAELLSIVATRLPVEQQASVLAEALAVARTLDDDLNRAEALSAIATNLLITELALLPKVLDAARSISNDKWWTMVLDAVDKRLPANDPTRLAEMLAVIRTINNEGKRAEALGIAAKYLPPNSPDLLTEALIIGYTIGDPMWRCVALSAVAERLPPDQQLSTLAEALMMVYTINDEERRVKAWDAIVERVPLYATKLLAEALLVVHTFDDELRRAMGLTIIAKRLPSDQQPAVLKDALTAARAIDDESWKSVALRSIAEQLSSEQRSSVLTEALAAIRVISDEGVRIRLLVPIAKLLPANDSELLNEMLAIIRELRDRAAALKAVMALMPPSTIETQIELLLSELLQDPSVNFIVLPSLAPYWRGLDWIQDNNEVIAIHKVLRALSNTKRQNLLGAIEALLPVIARLGGEHAVRETAQAVLDTAKWWP